MLVIVSAMSLAGGVAAACAAEYSPSRGAPLERWGGGLLVAGFALLGCALGAALPITHV
ncbi:MAG: hypothetical protein ABSG83_16275 [Roseiarcus sp.]|jgi:hypothetical protein